MSFISRIDNAYVWARSGGVYRQCELYFRNDQLFARWGGGYIRLGAHGSTSAPKVFWNEIDAGDLALIREANGQPPLYLGEAKEKPKRITKAA